MGRIQLDPKYNLPDRLCIFFDGGCKVCAWEVKKYLAADIEKRLGTIDINAPGFDASLYGLDSFRVRKYFHVLTPAGEVIAGVDAFIEIWKVLDTPASKLGARIARVPLVHFLMGCGYSIFVLIRPFLPRNRELACVDGSCDFRPRKG